MSEGPRQDDSPNYGVVSALMLIPHPILFVFALLSFGDSAYFTLMALIAVTGLVLAVAEFRKSARSEGARLFAFIGGFLHTGALVLSAVSLVGRWATRLST